jgi:hypothetical protein
MDKYKNKTYLVFMKTFQEFINESRRFTKSMKRAKNNVSQDKTVEAEKDEFRRYPNSSKLMQRAKTSPTRNLTDQEVTQLTNSDASSISPGAKGRRKARRLARSYGKDIDRVRSQIKKGSNQPSIVHKGELIAGNTRAMVLRSLNRKVPVIDVR